MIHVDDKVQRVRLIRLATNKYVKLETRQAARQKLGVVSVVFDMTYEAVNIWQRFDKSHTLITQASRPAYMKWIHRSDEYSDISLIEWMNGVQIGYIQDGDMIVVINGMATRLVLFRDIESMTFHAFGYSFGLQRQGYDVNICDLKHHTA